MSTKTLQIIRVLAFVIFGCVAVCLTQFPEHAFLVAGIGLIPLMVIGATTVVIRYRPGFERQRSWLEDMFNLPK